MGVKEKNSDIIMAENFSDVTKNYKPTDSRISKNPSSGNITKTTLRHIVTMLLTTNVKRENLKSRQRRMTHHTQRNIIKIKADFFLKTMQAKRQWINIFKLLNHKKLI